MPPRPLPAELAPPDVPGPGACPAPYGRLGEPIDVYPSGPNDLDLSTLDPGIARFVQILRAHGVETYESCQGGPGHCSANPFVKFHGSYGAGWRALQVALDYALPVGELRRVWSMIDGEPTGPHWKLTFKAWADGTRVALWWLDRVPPAPSTEQG